MCQKGNRHGGQERIQKETVASGNKDNYQGFWQRQTLSDNEQIQELLMKYLCIIIIALSLCFFLPSANAAEKDNFQFKKQTELQQIKPKKPVKIKLRRSAKDEYTWELSGDDTDEILRTDKKLRRMLNTR